MSYEGNIEDVEQRESIEANPEGVDTDKVRLGELCGVPSEGQFANCELVDDDTADLIGFITEGDTSKEATDQEVREAIREVEGEAVDPEQVAKEDFEAEWGDI